MSDDTLLVEYQGPSGELHVGDDVFPVGLPRLLSREGIARVQAAGHRVVIIDAPAEDAPARSRRKAATVSVTDDAVTADEVA